MCVVYEVRAHIWGGTTKNLTFSLFEQRPFIEKMKPYVGVSLYLIPIFLVTQKA